LDSLKKEGYKNENIVILSPLGTNALVHQLENEGHWETSITANPEPVPGKLRYSTIHSFKGLEAPIVIITDVEHVSTRKDQMLLYTGLTRSTDRVYAFVNQNARNDLINILSS
jgi:superfamily I DNA/RNA helicase